jgi:carboxylesterase type B
MQISLINSLKLGAFGFLSSTEIEQNGALNAGILDMAFALQWVQDHIDQFGSDKLRVTIVVRVLVLVA